MIKSRGLPVERGEYRKVSITLPRDLEDFLDSIRKKIRDRSGRSITRTEIVRAALELIRERKIDFHGDIKNEQDLLKELKKAFRED
jgi:Arc/MetJ-type ribon-helix-helix transcriptional regulator